jgi:hypothetical protein
MASKTKHTELVRKHKLVRQGIKRKAKLRNEGSTKSKKELFGDK